MSLTARFYDPLLFLAMRSIRRAVWRELIDLREKPIIDLCGGTGNQLKLLARNGFTDLHCVDLSPEMLAIAGSSPYPIEIYEQDATSTGFNNNQFAAAIISFALHEKDHATAAALLREARRILKPDGRLIIVDFVFDADSTVLGRAMVRTVEWLAGGDHYRNFKKYINQNGLFGLIDPTVWQITNSLRILRGAAVISVFKAPHQLA